MLPGCVKGLTVSDSTSIESVVLPGKGNIRYTGKLGDVMQESIQAAFTVVRSRAQALGLDILQAAPGTRGPSDDDIAAASEMSDEDRNAMVEGMVAGLAAKLEENPDNPDGWIMLVRSYSVLGKPEKARSSYETALAHFDGQASVQARLKAEAGSILNAD